MWIPNRGIELVPCEQILQARFPQEFWDLSDDGLKDVMHRAQSTLKAHRKLKI